MLLKFRVDCVTQHQQQAVSSWSDFHVCPVQELFNKET